MFARLKRDLRVAVERTDRPKSFAATLVLSGFIVLLNIASGVYSLYEGRSSGITSITLGLVYGWAILLLVQKLVVVSDADQTFHTLYRIAYLSPTQVRLVAQIDPLEFDVLDADGRDQLLEDVRMSLAHRVLGHDHVQSVTVTTGPGVDLGDSR